MSASYKIKHTFDIPQDPDVFARDEVDGDTLPPEATAPANAMDVVLTVARQVVVDHQRYLLHVDPPGPDICRDQDARVGLTKVLHDAVSLLLRHLAMHRRHREVRLAHLVREPVDLPAGVTEDDGLGDGEGVVEVAERVEFPLLLLDRDEVLLQSLERQLVALDQDSNRVGHELGRHVQDVVRKGGRHDDDLRGRGQVAVHIVDLFPESAVQQLVGFIQHQHLDVARSKVAPPDHIRHPARRSRHNVLSVVEFADILADVGAADACVALHIHVVSQSHDHRLDLRRKFARRGEDQGYDRRNQTSPSKTFAEAHSSQYLGFP